MYRAGGAAILYTLRRALNKQIARTYRPTLACQVSVIGLFMAARAYVIGQAIYIMGILLKPDMSIKCVFEIWALESLRMTMIV